jgi:hypothetical protein
MSRIRASRRNRSRTDGRSGQQADVPARAGTPEPDLQKLAVDRTTVHLAANGVRGDASID